MVLDLTSRCVLSSPHLRWKDANVVVIQKPGRLVVDDHLAKTYRPIAMRSVGSFWKFLAKVATERLHFDITTQELIPIMPFGG